MTENFNLKAWGNYWFVLEIENPGRADAGLGGKMMCSVLEVLSLNILIDI